MAKKKSELQSDRAQYDAYMQAAWQAQSTGMYQHVVRLAANSLPFVDGMMEYGRRFEEQEFRSIQAIDLILRYAPLLFDRDSLWTLEQTLKSQKRIDRNATDDLAGRLTAAYQALWFNHQLWCHIEKAGEVRQDELGLALGGDQDYWRWVCESWDVMGLVSRVPARGSYLVSLKTRSGQVVKAKCSNCGKPQEAPKAMFFEEMVCPECRAISWFVILVA